VQVAGAGVQADPNGTAAAAAAPKKPKKPLPEGWKKVKDAKTGRTYYYNKDTRVTSWKRPK
jgi:hypothetical protein